jgi:hypothetical protein
MEVLMPDSESAVIFMILPLGGIDEALIPSVLASRGVPHVVVERFRARLGSYVEIQVPASHLDEARQALKDAIDVGQNLDKNMGTDA